MKKMQGALLSLAVMTSGTSPHAASLAPRTAPAARPRIVHVARPTGDRTTDHASIVAAFGSARPGDTIQFARGTYVVGRLIEDSTPGLTLLGAAAGTVLQGCTPDGYETLRRDERELHEAVTWSHGRRHVPPDIRRREAVLVKRCGVFHLTGGRDTVRNLTFEYMRIGVALGHEYQKGYRLAEGGYLVEGNTFRNSDNGVRAGLWSAETTVIRHNTFVDTYHAVMAAGSHIHLLENTILAPVPKQVPADQFPSLALAISTMVRGPNGAPPEPTPGRCGGNVIAGNVIDGYPSGIALGTYPDTLCRGNVVRDNTIAVRRVAFLRTSIGWGVFPLSDTTDPTFVGVPIRVSEPGIGARSERLEDTRIEGNRILGAEGYGIAIRHASNVRIADNMIAGILLRDPYPGNANSGPKSPNANGAGIWLSAGSAENQIVDNTFADIATYPVVLEGDSNTVRTLSARDSVRDLGTGNRVTRRER